MAIQSKHSPSRTVVSRQIAVHLMPLRIFLVIPNNCVTKIVIRVALLRLLIAVVIVDVNPGAEYLPGIPFFVTVVWQARFDFSANAPGPQTDQFVTMITANFGDPKPETRGGVCYRRWR